MKAEEITKEIQDAFQARPTHASSFRWEWRWNEQCTEIAVNKSTEGIKNTSI